MKKTNSINGFAYSHIGAHKVRENEDRSFWGNIKTAGGLNLAVAMVSDGVGGGNLGQLAAQLAIDTIREHILGSDLGSEKEIPQLLGSAIGAANKKVYAESRVYKNKSDMAATIAVAVVCNGKLYVANVGDSRIYLIQDNKTIKQITVDHTYAYEKIRQGVPREKIIHHPNASYIARSVGSEPQVVVDLGLYLEGGAEDGKTAFSNQGIQLSKDDVVLVCSDGLVKEINGNIKQHYVEEKDIIAILEQYRAEQAAKVMVDLAVGRNVDDNVTAVIVEFSNRKLAVMPRRSKIIYALSSFLIVALLVVVSRVIGLREELSELTEANINSTSTSIAGTETASSFTQTPTMTPRPTLVPGEIGSVVLEGVRLPFFANSPVTVSSFSQIRVNHTGEFEDGVIYMFPQSRLLFEAEPTDAMNFVVFPGSHLLIEPGRYIAGAGVRIAGARGIVDFGVSGSCLGIKYLEEQVVAYCYEGNCNYQLNFGEKIPIIEGAGVQIDINTLGVNMIAEIPLSDISDWLDALPRESKARQCVQKYMPFNVGPTKDNQKDNDGVAPTDSPIPPTSGTPKPPPRETPGTPPSYP